MFTWNFFTLNCRNSHESSHYFIGKLCENRVEGFWFVNFCISNNRKSATLHHTIRAIALLVAVCANILNKRRRTVPALPVLISLMCSEQSYDLANKEITSDIFKQFGKYVDNVKRNNRLPSSSIVFRFYTRKKDECIHDWNCHTG